MRTGCGLAGSLFSSQGDEVLRIDGQHVIEPPSGLRKLLGCELDLAHDDEGAHAQIWGNPLCGGDSPSGPNACLSIVSTTPSGLGLGDRGFRLLGRSTWARLTGRRGRAVAAARVGSGCQRLSSTADGRGASRR